MVCARCIMVVDNIFKAQGLEPVVVSLGEANLFEEITSSQLSDLSVKLQEKGFELIARI